MLKKILAIAFSLTFLIGVFSFNVSASENTTYTYTISVDDEWIRTQDAYMASEIIFKDYDLSQPSDIFISGRNLYVAGSGNSRIVIYNLDTKERGIKISWNTWEQNRHLKNGDILKALYQIGVDKD